LTALAKGKDAHPLHVLELLQAVDAVLRLVLGADVAASVFSVNFHLATEHHVFPAPRDGFAQLHQKHPGGFWIARRSCGRAAAQLPEWHSTTGHYRRAAKVI
jgi:hypothetical protein